jgi:hypothetical protein
MGMLISMARRASNLVSMADGQSDFETMDKHAREPPTATEPGENFCVHVLE